MGNELHSRINMAATVNAAQMQRNDKWTTSSEIALSGLRQQMEADRTSMDAQAKELETVKKDQAAGQTASGVGYTAWNAAKGRLVGRREA